MATTTGLAVCLRQFDAHVGAGSLNVFENQRYGV
jgi:hypothetical protein